MTADEPVEGQPIVADFADGTRIAGYLSRSVPVESREQSRGERYERWRELIYGGTSFDDGPRTGHAMRLSDLEQTRPRAERDRARDLAAHLEEQLARLRAGIQGDIDSQRLLGFHFVPSPALTAHLEAEQAEGPT